MDDDRLSEVAFGAHPGVSVGRVGRAGPAVRWAAAVALGGQGHYAAAAALLETLRREPRVPVEIRAHALVARASHLRQRGGHALAERLDGQALALTAGVPGGSSEVGCATAPEPAAAATASTRGVPPRTATAASARASPRGVSGPAGHVDRAGREATAADHGAAASGFGRACADLLSARVDALAGLAADALGQGGLDRAARLLTRADAVLAAAPEGGVAGSVPWRPAVRTAWVHAELALARADLDTASAAAARAVRGAAAAGSVRHLLKSRLLAAVVASVRAAAGDGGGTTGAVEGPEGVVAPAPEAALAVLDTVAAEASAAGLLPLAWAALLAAADAAATVVRRVAAASATVAPGSPPPGAPEGAPAGSRNPRTGPAEVLPEASRAADPPGAAARPSGPPSEGSFRHDRRSDRLLRSTIGAPNGATGRRHAAAATLSVIRARSEGRGRRLMGEAPPGERRLAVV
ncbi:hypothetical protein LWC35_33815 [Pseudonocardia kujensis]|uniref:hypothetical protein n=1 Tax=Pseudonocardia kujensis TaxID=1128675 RepID=UPI001E589DFF|nr:hypothetical protein [Pseudonocardia kujensis]MCE0767842.1 hypothetical protein [Pseudonocardia kujensis]